MLMNTTNPIRKLDIIAQDLWGGTFPCSPEAKAIHIFNSTAQHIWQLCDRGAYHGGHGTTLRAGFSVTAEYDVTGDISRILETFGGKGLYGDPGRLNSEEM